MQSAEDLDRQRLEAQRSKDEDMKRERAERSRKNAELVAQQKVTTVLLGMPFSLPEWFSCPAVLMQMTSLHLLSVELGYGIMPRADCFWNALSSRLSLPRGWKWFAKRQSTSMARRKGAWALAQPLQLNKPAKAGGAGGAGGRGGRGGEATLIHTCALKIRPLEES